MQRDRHDGNEEREPAEDGAFHPAILNEKARAPHSAPGQNDPSENDPSENDPNGPNGSERLKGELEPELHHARLVGERRVRGRLPEGHEPS